MDINKEVYANNPKRKDIEPKIKRQFFGRFTRKNPTQDSIIKPDDKREFWMLVDQNDRLHELQSKRK